ncbi:MAG TPA: tyrosine-type recombinase/integrase [Ohtaekwangia sp.]
MIDSFLKYLQFEKRVSPKTVLAYQTDLVQFNDHINTNFSGVTIDSASYNIVRSWIVALFDSGIEAQSINRKIACLRSYYKFLLRQELISKDPMMKIRILKTQKKLPSFIQESEIAVVLDKTLSEGAFTDLRDKLILELLYGTGVRLSELLSLKDSNIDLKNRTLKVRGKRNKERVIPFTENIVSIINTYREVRNRDVKSNDDGLLLITQSGDACYPMLVYRLVNEHLQSTNSEKKSPHVLRHTYATHLLNKGAEINAVKDLLGHSSLAATQVYTHNSIDKLKKVFDQAHPKA